MRKNVGSLDSAIRAMIGLGLLLGAGVSIQWPVVSAGCVLVSLLLLNTALAAWCPLYAVLGIATSDGDAGGRGLRNPGRDHLAAGASRAVGARRRLRQRR
jgi:hypothetical protein